ncbi:MAG: diacylglycerol kinase (ATP) [Oleiphilaceae bacterium]
MKTVKTPPKAVIIFNPLAGRGKAPETARKAKKYLQQQDWEVCTIVATHYAGHIETVLAKEWAKKVELIVLVGGDGTLRELVSGLWQAKLDVNIGFIPMGNANVVARELSIPLNSKSAIRLLTTGITKKVDICILKQQTQDDMIFLAMLEIGYGAKVIQFVDQLRNGGLKALYRLWGDLVYIIAGFLALKGTGKDNFTATIATLNTIGDVNNNAIANENITGSVLSSHCIIANMQTYAKGWSLTPEAKYDDGLLDIAISKKNNILTIIKTFFAATQKRKLSAPIMSYFQAEHVSISGQPSLFVQVDGDPISFSGQAEVIIKKAAFSIIANDKPTH